ncbi:MAG: hypothetical protein ABI690_23140 [Chloroflexota bacterium]
MQASRNSIHITSAEWRWVVIVAVGLTALAFIPFLWVAVSGVSGTDWQFMGVLNNYRDGATYLSKMAQGMEGSWLINFRHTPEDHSAVFIQALYPTLGQLARLVRIPSIALFHAARVVASLIMYLALYHLAASIWTRLRTRRLFFLLVAFCSGLGWLFSNGDVTFPDLSIAEMYPFYSSLVNVHFPLSIACLALLTSIFITEFRPGAVGDPGISNGGLIAGLLSFALSLLFPQALVPFGIAIGLYVLIYWYQKRKFTGRELRWLLVLTLPAIPMAAYYVAIVSYNPVIAEWNRQNITPAPSPINFVLGLGVPLLIALPGIYRAVRRFEADGDRLMLLWFVAMVVLMYLPTNIQRRFIAGMMIPLAYFATRALEDFWFHYVNRRWRVRLLVFVIPVMTFTNLLLLVLNLNVTVGPFLQHDYAVAFQWLKDRTTSDDVILASEPVSVWVPSWVGTRVVYGHPFETLNAEVKKQQVLDWYDGQTTDCKMLLTEYHVQYIIDGPEEAALGSTACFNDLNPVFQIGSVSVYAP